MFSSMESHSRQYARLREEQREKDKDGYKPPPTAAERKKRFERVEKIIPDTPTDVLKMRIDRMMSQPDKPMILPEPPKELSIRDPREFNRHIMGSTAAAGSGEFHVYRATRRREYMRQDFMEYVDKKEKAENEFNDKKRELEYDCEASTAKKRLKRQKQKAAKAAYEAKQREEAAEKKRVQEEAKDKEERLRRKAARKQQDAAVLDKKEKDTAKAKDDASHTSGGENMSK